MKTFVAMLIATLAAISCSEIPKSPEESSETVQAAPSEDAIPFDTWSDISTDHPAIVSAVEWLGGSSDTVSTASVRVTRDFEYILVSRTGEGTTITEKVARPRWKVVDADKGIIARNHDATGYQLLARNIVQATPGDEDAAPNP